MSWRHRFLFVRKIFPWVHSYEQVNGIMAPLITSTKDLIALNKVCKSTKTLKLLLLKIQIMHIFQMASYTIFTSWAPYQQQQVGRRWIETFTVKDTDKGYILRTYIALKHSSTYNNCPIILPLNMDILL